MCPLVKIDPLTFCSFIISVLSWRGKEIAVFFFFISIALLFCFFAIYLFIVISSLLTRTCQSMILKLFLWHYHIVLTEESWHALSSQDPYAFTWFCPHGSHRLSWNIPLILTSLCCCNHFTLFHCKKKNKSAFDANQCAAYLPVRSNCAVHFPIHSFDVFGISC